MAKKEQECTARAQKLIAKHGITPGTRVAVYIESLKGLCEFKTLEDFYETARTGGREGEGIEEVRDIAAKVPANHLLFLYLGTERLAVTAHCPKENTDPFPLPADSSKTIDIVVTAALPPEKQKAFETLWEEMALGHGALFTSVVVLPDKKTQSFMAAFSHDDKGARSARRFGVFLKSQGVSGGELVEKGKSANA